jgi:RimJ/RimL family protein N-acetyltransferase/8-oxo-dGTP pyrophosphatase MutT (NUDIX family)
MIAVSGPIVTTPRLILRPWRADDLAAFADMNADPRVMKYMFKMLNRQQSDEVAEKLAAHFARHGFGKWAVEAPGVASFIGCVGIAHVSYQTPAHPCVEIGWRLAFDYWGRGYATEAARAALEYGFTQLKLDQIVSMTVPANEQSWMLMERLGMKRNPEDDFDHPRVAPGHPLSRHMLYRLSRADWEAQIGSIAAPATPRFGHRFENRSYIFRPGSYAVIANPRGQVCVVEGLRGNGLPGGGAEGGEKPEQTLHREMREECGREIIIEREVGFAIEFVHSVVEGNFEKHCTFFQAQFADDGKPVTAEPGISLLWLPPAEAIAVLTPESHRWAVARAGVSM